MPQGISQASAVPRVGQRWFPQARGAALDTPAGRHTSSVPAPSRRTGGPRRSHSRLRFVPGYAKLLRLDCPLSCLESAEFDDLVSGLKLRDDTGELSSKSLQQHLLPAIADPHPNQLAGPARNTDWQRVVEGKR